MMGYYDYVLGLIPVSFLGITGILQTAGLEVTAAVPFAALVAALFVGHALFVRAPVDTADRRPIASAD